MDKKQQPVFTPTTEPYLGRELLFHFDKTISWCLEQNRAIAPKTHDLALTDHQKMACQVIPQAVSIALSIRELIRQGYLFGAHVLNRPLAERAAILLYLHKRPNEIDKWNRGWIHGDAPSLVRMFEALQEGSGVSIRGTDLTSAMNSIMHGRADSAAWSTVTLPNGRLGHAPSKMLNRPELCDEVCANALPWLVTVTALINAYFPNKDGVPPN